MRRNIRKTNNSIMFGIIGLALVVLMVVLLFWVLCLPPDKSILPALTE